MHNITSVHAKRTIFKGESFFLIQDRITKRVCENFFLELKQTVMKMRDYLLFTHVFKRVKNTKRFELDQQV